MKIKLKRAAQLGSQIYPIGTHDVPDGVEDHWYFKALMADGHIAVLEEKKIPAKKCEEPKAEEPKEEDADPVEEEAAGEPAAESEAADAPKPEGKKKKKNGR